jgi:hypothetical protein
MTKLFDLIKSVIKEATLNPNTPLNVGAVRPNTTRPRPVRITPIQKTNQVQKSGQAASVVRNNQGSGGRGGMSASYAKDTRPATVSNNQGKTGQAASAVRNNTSRPTPSQGYVGNAGRTVNANAAGKGDGPPQAAPSTAQKAAPLSNPQSGAAQSGVANKVKPTQVVKPMPKPARPAGAKVRAAGAGGAQRSSSASISNKAPKAPKVTAPTVKTNFKGGLGQKGVSRFDTSRSNK